MTTAIGGTRTTGNVLTLSVYDVNLASGVESVSYTVLAADTLTTIATGLTVAINADTNLQAVGVTATSSGTVVTLKSVSTSATTYKQSTSSGSTETLTLSTGTGPQQAMYNELNELIYNSPGGPVNFKGTTNKAVKSVSVNSKVVSISSTPPVSPFLTTYTLSASTGPFVTQNFFRGAVQIYNGGFGDGPPTGSTYVIHVAHPSLPNGVENVNYTSTATDTYASVATNISTAFNADLAVQSLGLSSTASSQTISVVTNFPTYTASTSVGATETLSVGHSYEGRSAIAVGGTPTTADVLSIITHYPSLTGQQEVVSYTVQSTDTLTSIAAALSTAMNADTHLQAIDLSSSAVTPAVLSSSQSFAASPVLANGSNAAVVSAIDGGNNTKSNNYQVSTKGAGGQALTYDLNGNMTSDGTNSYAWDAENRLIQINYPGTGNNSQLRMMGLGEI